MEKDNEKSMFQRLKKLMTATENDAIDESESTPKQLKEAKPPAKIKAAKEKSVSAEKQEIKKDKPKKPFLKIVGSDPHFSEDEQLSSAEEPPIENEDEVELIGSSKNSDSKSEAQGKDDEDYSELFEDDKPYDLEQLTAEPARKPRKKKKSFLHSVFKIGQALNAKPNEFVSDEDLSGLNKIATDGGSDDAAKQAQTGTAVNAGTAENVGEKSENVSSATATEQAPTESSLPPAADIAEIDMSFATVQKVNGNIFIQGDIEPMYTIESAPETFNVEIGKLSPILMVAYEAYLEPEALEAKKAEQAKKQEELKNEEIITTTTSQPLTEINGDENSDELFDDSNEPVLNDIAQEREKEHIIQNKRNGEENKPKSNLSKKELKKELKKQKKLEAKKEREELKRFEKEQHPKNSVRDKLFSDYGTLTDYSVSASDNTEAETVEDYETLQDARAVMVEINMNIRRLFFRTLTVGIIFVLAMVFTIFQRFCPTIVDGVISNADIVYCVANLVLLSAAVGVSAATIKNGLIPLLGFKGNSDTAVAVAVVAVVIQCVISFFDSRSFYYGSQSLYVILVLFALVLNPLGKMIMELRIKDNFRFVAQDRKKYAATILNDRRNAEKMVRGTNAADPIIAYQRKTGFYNNFLKLSRAKDPSESMAAKFSLIGLVCAVVVAILHGIIFKSVSGAFSAFALVACLSIPSASLIAVNLPIKRLCKKALRSDAMIVGYPAVTQFVDTAAIMADGKELYPQSSVKLVALRPYVTFNLEECLLNAAAVLKAANTSLTYVFADVISKKEDELPFVDSIKFEENRGLLGWIGGERVLIGRRELLQKYGVTPPPYEDEKPFIEEHRNVTYIANAGQLVAMVVSSYAPDEKIKQELHRLEDNGVTILVRTADPNMTSKGIAKDYGLHIGSVKILPNSLGNICKEAINEKSRRARCYIGTRGKLYSLARAVSGCIKIKSSITTAVIIQIIGVVSGILVTSLVALASGDQGIKAFELLFFMVFWALAAVLVPLIQKT